MLQDPATCGSSYLWVQLPPTHSGSVYKTTTPLVVEPNSISSEEAASTNSLYTSLLVCGSLSLSSHWLGNLTVHALNFV